MLNRELLIKCIHYNAPDVRDLIKLAVGAPSPDKVQAALLSYKEAGHYLLGCYREHKLIGLIGINIEDTEGIVNHIAVFETSQRKGVGMRLITEVRNRFQIITCKAETDIDGKAFYEKCGFNCVPFEGKYNTRYSCIWSTN